MFFLNTTTLDHAVFTWTAQSPSTMSVVCGLRIINVLQKWSQPNLIKSFEIGEIIYGISRNIMCLVILVQKTIFRKSKYFYWVFTSGGATPCWQNCDFFLINIVEIVGLKDVQKQKKEKRSKKAEEEVEHEENDEEVEEDAAE